MRHWRKYLQNELPQVHASLSFQSGLCTAEPALGIQLAEEIWEPSVSRTVSFSDSPHPAGISVPARATASLSTAQQLLRP